MGLFPQNDLLQMQSRIEAPALVDADVLQPTAQKMLLAGQAAGHLQQLSSQLALEKAQRKAEMATTDYHIAAIAGMQERLPGLNQQLQVEQDAALLKAKQDEFDRKLGLEVSGQNRTLAVDAAAGLLQPWACLAAAWVCYRAFRCPRARCRSWTRQPPPAT